MPPEAKDPKWLIMNDVMMNVIKGISKEVASDSIADVV